VKTMVRIPKQRLDIYISMQSYAQLIKYAEARRAKTLSNAIERLLKEYFDLKKKLREYYSKELEHESKTLNGDSEHE